MKTSLMEALRKQFEEEDKQTEVSKPDPATTEGRNSSTLTLTAIFIAFLTVQIYAKSADRNIAEANDSTRLGFRFDRHRLLEEVQETTFIFVSQSTRFPTALFVLESVLTYYLIFIPVFILHVIHGSQNYRHPRVSGTNACRRRNFDCHDTIERKTAPE